MKISWALWWVVNVFWLIVFALGTAFLWLREVDGAGAIQTPEIKFLSFIVLLFAFIFPIIFQGGWLIINLVINKKRKGYV